MTNEEMARKHFELGNDYFGKGNNVQAIVELNKAIEYGSSNPNLVMAILGSLGYAYKFNEEYDKAITYLTKFIEMSPNVRAVIDRGKTYYLNGDINKAIADFEIVLQAEPSNDEAKTLLNEIKKQRGF